MDLSLILIILQVLALITILVAAHELGHYLFARLFGMGVEEFAVGVGRPRWTWMKRRYKVDPKVETKTDSGEEPNISAAPDYETTSFTIRPLPIGGFVRIKGMVPEEDGSEVKVPGGFYSKAPWQRFVVLLMGPVFSILAGFAILIPSFMLSGIHKPLNVPKVPFLNEEGPAYQAGIRKDDVILQVDDTKVSTYYDVLTRVRDRGRKPVELLVDRKGEQLTFTVIPLLDKSPTPVIGPDLEPTSEKKIQSKLGMGVPTHKVLLTFGEASLEAVALPLRMAASIAGIFTQPSRAKDEVGGPIAIATIAGATAREGISEFVMFGGALSISLGIFNLLPIGFLDGGQMVVALVEWFRRGRRLSFRVQNWVAGIGAILLFALIISVVSLDVSRAFGGERKVNKGQAAPQKP